MKKRKHVIIFFSLLLMVSSQTNLNAKWIDFIKSSGHLGEVPDSYSDQLPTDIYVESNPDAMTITFWTFGANQDLITGANQIYTLLSIPNYDLLDEPGKPKVPVWSSYIEIPDGKIAVVDTAYSQSCTFGEIIIVPTQHIPIPEIKGIDESKFEVEPDQETYNPEIRAQGFFPKIIYQLEKENIVRGNRIQLLRVYPIHYSHHDELIKAFYNIRINILFKPTGKKRKAYHKRRLAHSVFDHLLSRICLNYKPGSSSQNILKTRAAYETGNSFWIITDSLFIDAAEKLKQWKIRKGISTIVKTTDEIGKTAEQIRNAISNAYQNDNPPPTYILIIGDSELIPVSYKTKHMLDDKNDINLPYQGKIGTDLYYAAVDGDDYYPDISIGRLSVDTPQQADKRVNDIIEYEKNPPVNKDFYEKISLCSFFHDKDKNGIKDGYSNYRFVQTSEDIAIFMQDQNYVINRIYSKDDETVPQYWSKNHANFSGPAGQSGDTIVDYLKGIENLSWNGNHAHVTNQLHNGNFLIVHRGHGDMKGWEEPGFNVENVLNLNNANLKPLVLSINCMTGWFDNETDEQNSITEKDDICFSEAWERNNNGGAIGIIAPTRASYSFYNDRLTWGIMDAIWPDFISKEEDQAFFLASLKTRNELGAVLNYAKFYMAAHFTDKKHIKEIFEMFHLFGDPTLQIHTTLPKQINVDHNDLILPGTNSIDLTIDQQDALICITQNDRILYKDKSSPGMNSISIAEFIHNKDPFYVSVTGPTLKTYVNRIINVPSICNPPESGDWVVTNNCILKESTIAPANVIVKNNSILVIAKEKNLDIDLKNYHLTVENGSGVLIKAGGNIK